MNFDTLGYILGFVLMIPYMIYLGINWLVTLPKRLWRKRKARLEKT
jgi:hypothetical protein